MSVFYFKRLASGPLTRRRRGQRGVFGRKGLRGMKEAREVGAVRDPVPHRGGTFGPRLWSGTLHDPRVS